MKLLTFFLLLAFLQVENDSNCQTTLKGNIFFRERITDDMQKRAKGASYIDYPGVGVKILLINRDDPGSERALDLVDEKRFDCDASLSSLKYNSTITNSAGDYYFKNVQPGRYIIKVCKRRGNYYEFKVKKITSSYQLIPPLSAIDD